MSSLPNNTFASPGNPFYALIGSGGGGGSASSLQSPASIIPDGTLGDAVLNVDSAGGASFAALTVRGGATADGDILLGGGGSTYDMKASGVAGNFTIGVQPAQVNQTPFITYSPAGDLLLGDNVLAGKVLTNQLFQVQGNPANGNAVQIQSLSATVGNISQASLGSGVLTLGSSATFPNTLQISDVAYLGAGNYVEVNGAAGQAPLFISGAQGIAGECGIHPDATDGSGQLLLGSDNTHVDLIRLSSTATSLKNLGGAPQLLFGPQNVTSPFTSTFPTPASEGLYAIVGSSVPTSTQNSRDGQLSSIAYINSGRQCQMGGSANADVGGVGGTDSLLISPTSGATTFNINYTGAQQLNNFAIYAFKLSGPIVGTV
jgi:hypothetical protein